MQIQIVTLFPEMIEAAAGIGVCGRALSEGIASLACINPRDFAQDAHGTVDDRPYGGGPGMVLKVEPFRTAIRAARRQAPESTPVVFLTPKGQVFDQSAARALAEGPGMVLVAGRYEGFDERLLKSEADLQLSLGDFVLSGGEVAALAVMDAVLRLKPGVLGDPDSADQDSFSEGLLDCPHYTRPEELDGMVVPRVLLEGNHEQIRRWRLKQALGSTWMTRPELLNDRDLSEEEQILLDEFLEEQT